MGLFNNSRELQFGIHKLWQNHKQVQQIKARNVTLGEGGSWEGCSEWKSMGENQELRVMMVSHGLSCRSSWVLAGMQCTTFPVGACNWVFPLKDSSLGVCNWQFILWLMLSGTGSPFWLSDSIFMRFPCINFHRLNSSWALQNLTVCLWVAWSKG